MGKTVWLIKCSASCESTKMVRNLGVSLIRKWLLYKSHLCSVNKQTSKEWNNKKGPVNSERFWWIESVHLSVVITFQGLGSAVPYGLILFVIKALHIIYFHSMEFMQKGSNGSSLVCDSSRR